jgi:hypothetical protein
MDLTQKIRERQRALLEAKNKTSLDQLPNTFVGFLQKTLALDNLTPEQLTLCRVIFDKDDPIDLDPSERAAARVMFGDIDRINPAARHTIVMMKGARVGGTWLWSLFLLYTSLTCDLTRLAPGERAFAAVVAERMELGIQSINYIKGALERGGLSHLSVGDKTESVVIRRGHGLFVTIKVFAASRGGISARGRSYVGALLDEAAFFRAADGSVVNDAEIHRAISMRVMAGGVVGLVSTAWAEAGLMWELLKYNLGTPGGELNPRQETALACITPTELLRHDEKIAADIAIARATDPENAAREFDCIPLSTNTARFLSPAEVYGCVVDEFPDLSPNYAQVGAGVDTALKRDSAALVVVYNEGGISSVAETVERRPTPNEPLKLSEVCSAYADVMKRHQVFDAASDEHEFVAAQEHLANHGVGLSQAPDKEDSYLHMRTLFRERSIRIHRSEEKLITQLLDIVSKPMPSGALKITSPRTRSGHGDIASAFVLALWQATQGSSGSAGISKALD